MLGQVYRDLLCVWSFAWAKIPVIIKPAATKIKIFIESVIPALGSSVIGVGSAGGVVGIGVGGQVTVIPSQTGPKVS